MGDDGAVLQRGGQDFTDPLQPCFQSGHVLQHAGGRQSDALRLRLQQSSRFGQRISDVLGQRLAEIPPRRERALREGLSDIVCCRNRWRIYPEQMRVLTNSDAFAQA